MPNKTLMGKLAALQLNTSPIFYAMHSNGIESFLRERSEMEWIGVEVSFDNLVHIGTRVSWHNEAEFW